MRNSGRTQISSPIVPAAAMARVLKSIPPVRIQSNLVQICIIQNLSSPTRHAIHRKNMDYRWVNLLCLQRMKNSKQTTSMHTCKLLKIDEQVKVADDDTCSWLSCRFAFRPLLTLRFLSTHPDQMARVMTCNFGVVWYWIRFLTARISCSGW